MKDAEPVRSGFKYPRGRRITKKPKENTVERHLVKRVKELGGLCWKFTSPSLPGVPDRMIVLNGTVSFVEVKRPGKKPEAHQRVAIATLRRHGIVAGHVDTKEAADAFLVRIMERDHETTPVIPVITPNTTEIADLIEPN